MCILFEYEKIRINDSVRLNANINLIKEKNVYVKIWKILI